VSCSLTPPKRRHPHESTRAATAEANRNRWRRWAACVCRHLGRSRSRPAVRRRPESENEAAESVPLPETSRRPRGGRTGVTPLMAHAGCLRPDRRCEQKTPQRDGDRRAARARPWVAKIRPTTPNAVGDDDLDGATSCSRARTSTTSEQCGQCGCRSVRGSSTRCSRTARTASIPPMPTSGAIGGAIPTSRGGTSRSSS